MTFHLGLLHHSNKDDEAHKKQVVYEDTLRLSLLLNVYDKDGITNFRWVQILNSASNFVVFIVNNVNPRLSFIDVHVWAILLADRKVLGIPSPFMCDKVPGGDKAMLIYNVYGEDAKMAPVQAFGRLLLNPGLYLA